MKNRVLEGSRWIMAAAFALTLLTSPVLLARQAPDSASAHGKYSDLVQELHCPRDKQKYGSYKDWGYWKGGRWCGVQGQAGYWVWVDPNWYVWQTRNAQELPEAASAYGKYSNLVQKLRCPKDRKKYGEYQDWGYWKGGRWCGARGKAGYWVWVAPDWYVWSTMP